MSKKTIKGIQLQQTVKKILDEYGDKVYDVLDDCVKNVSDEAAEKLRGVATFSPRGRPSGAYSKSWVSEKQRTGRLTVKYVVHNEEHYRLAHLLEKGHALRNGGREVGKSPAYPHIKPVEEWAQNELPQKVKMEIEKS